MIVYFSGTGNSGYAAKFLADKLDDEIRDSFHFIKDSIAAEFVSDRPWVFVAPTYGWQLPRIFMDFIRSGDFSGSKDAYFFMTCGGDVGNAEKTNKELCLKKGFNYKGTCELVMPENYIAMFEVPQADEAQRIIEAAGPVLENCAGSIAKGQDLPPIKVGSVGSLKSGIVNKAFYSLFVKAKAFTVSDACISCGMCVEVCPLNNVKLVGGKPVWADDCTHCMACISYCPPEAIEYGKKSQGKPRYQCPPYQG
ncbi:MAG: 4Fe-4S binding protein [Clostridiales bacterium]|nr:4Fe-4S binding protein [Clostridiales bacterium]